VSRDEMTRDKCLYPYMKTLKTVDATRWLKDPLLNVLST